MITVFGTFRNHQYFQTVLCSDSSTCFRPALSKITHFCWIFIARSIAFSEIRQNHAEFSKKSIFVGLIFWWTRCFDLGARWNRNVSIQDVHDQATRQQYESETVDISSSLLSISLHKKSRKILSFPLRWKVSCHSAPESICWTCCKVRNYFLKRENVQWT